MHEVSAGKRVLHLCGNVKWKTDQANAKSTQTAAGHLAPAMRSTNEDNSFNPGICLKNCGADNQAISGLLAENAFRGLPQRFLPHRLSGRNRLHVSEHPAHAVTDHHVRPMIWIKFIGPGQFFAQSKSRIEDGVAGRVGKHPELIMFTDFRIGLKSIDRLHPVERR